MSKTLQAAGRDDRAIVLRNGSASESGSALTRSSAQIITDAPGIKHDKDGKPMVSAEPLRMLKLFKRDDGSEVTALLRGVGAQVMTVRPEIQLIEGRMFEPSVNELIVGKAAKAQYKGMEIGSHIATRTATWAGGRHLHQQRRRARVGIDGRRRYRDVLRQRLDLWQHHRIA